MGKTQLKKGKKPPRPPRAAFKEVLTDITAFNAVAARPLRTALKNIYLRHVQKQAIDRLTQDGLAVIGKDAKPYTPDSAEVAVVRAMAVMGDDEVVAEGHLVGALGDGTILKRIGDFIQWLSDHSDQILKVVKAILSVIALLGL